MLNRTMSSTFLAAAVVSLSLMGCNSSNDTTPTASTPGPGEKTGRAVDNAARNTADAARDAANRTGAAVDRAADRTSNAANNAATDVHTTGNTAANGMPRSSDSNVPGMPSVNGTSTSGMSTADAAAQRLIDNAHNNIKQNDLSKAKTLLAELKDKGMYDSLSSAQKAKVDQLEQEINSTPGATAQENK